MGLHPELQFLHEIRCHSACSPAFCAVIPLPLLPEVLLSLLFGEAWLGCAQVWISSAASCLISLGFLNRSNLLSKLGSFSQLFIWGQIKPHPSSPLPLELWWHKYYVFVWGFGFSFRAVCASFDLFSLCSDWIISIVPIFEFSDCVSILSLNLSTKTLFLITFLIF